MSTRICISFDETPPGLCTKNVWFLFDKTSCRVVGDLEYLIRKKFDIKVLCNLHLNGFLLPSQEKIDLVRDGDNLMIENLPNNTKNASITSSETDYSQDTQTDQPSKRKKKHHHDKSEIENGNLSMKKKKTEKQKQKDKKLAKLSSRFAKTNGKLQQKQTKKSAVAEKSSSSLSSSSSSEDSDQEATTPTSRKTRPLTLKDKKRHVSSTSKASKFKNNSCISSSTFLTSGETLSSGPVFSNSRKKTRIQLNAKKRSQNSSDAKRSSSDFSSALRSLSEELPINDISSDHTSRERPSKKHSTKSPSTRMLNVKQVSDILSESSSSTKISCSTETGSTTRRKLPNSAPLLSPQVCRSMESSRIVEGILTQNRNASHIRFDSDEEESPVNQIPVSVNDTSAHVNACGLPGLSTVPQPNTVPHPNNNQSNLSTNEHQTENAELSNLCNGNATTIELPITQEQSQKKIALDYTTLPPLLGPPRTGDRIAYKVLEMSASYTPEMSDYKEGVVLEYNPASNEVLVELNEESLTIPRGDGNVSNKFELISDEEDEEDSTKPPPVIERKVAVCLSSMVEPRLISA